MSISVGRVRGLVAGVFGGLALTGALVLPGTTARAALAASPTPVPSSTERTDPSPTPTCPPLGCVVPTTAPPVVPSHTATATPRPTSTPSRTAAPVVRRTRRPSARPVKTQTSATTDAPSTPAVNIGGVHGAPSPTPSVKPKDSSSSSHSSDSLTRLLTLVLGGAIVLGLSGLAGLYLTRSR